MAQLLRDTGGDPLPADFLNVALTGGTGFIGGALISRLLLAGARVRALVRPASTSSCFEAPGLSWFKGDLGNGESLRQLVEGTSAVIHCAGSVRGSSEADFIPANVAGVERIVQAARESAGKRRFVLISSLAARSPEISPYAASKQKGEETLIRGGDGIDWTILRPPAVYGPGDRELLPLLKWIRRGVLFAPGGGSGRFSMIYVSDLAEAILACLANDGAVGGCFELHDGKTGGYSWEDVRETAVGLYRRSVHRIDIPRGVLAAAAGLNMAAARIIGYRPMLTPGKARELCHDDWTCDNAAICSVTGWQPAVGLAEGLRRTLN